MNPAIWVPDVAVWTNNKVTNFYYKVKLESDEQMFFVASHFELVTIALEW